MKRILTTILSMTLIACCTGCGKGAGASESLAETSNSLGGTSPDMYSDMSEQTSDEGFVKGDDFTSRENPRVNYTAAEAAEIIDKYPNLKASKELFVDIPKSIDHLSDFYIGSLPQPSQKEQLDEFKRLYSVLFPDRELDESRWTFHGFALDGNGELDINEPISDGSVSEYYDKLSREEVNLQFFCYEEKFSERDDPIYLLLRIPFGSDLTRINRGVANKLSEKNKGDELSSLFSLYDHFGYVASYAPDSNVKYKLLDKEVTIKEAVEFYESYVNSLAKEDYPFKTVVNSVSVYKLTEDSYGFSFDAVHEWENVKFASNALPGGRIRYASSDTMVKSDEIDAMIDSLHFSDTIVERSDFTDIVPFEEAVRIASEELTEYVEFDVCGAQLVYSVNWMTGSSQFGKTKSPASVGWRFSMKNPNDGLWYIAEVDAKTGKFDYTTMNYAFGDKLPYSDDEPEDIVGDQQTEQ